MSPALRREKRHLIMCDCVQYKVYLIGHPLRRTPDMASHADAFKAAGLPVDYERQDVPPVNFHRVMTSLIRDPDFLGAKVAVPYKQTALAYCQEISQAAQGIGAVNTLVRRPSGLVFGHNTDVAAFVQCVREQGVERVRTALILGAGGAARVTLAGLRELGCARYMVGYRHPRRCAELSGQFKGIRRQTTFFPLEEMVAFFQWTDRVKLFGDRPPMDPPQPGEDDGRKRWDLLVNATPVGGGHLAGQTLIDNLNFLRCFDRVLDLVPSPGPTRLVQRAREAQVPALEGLRVFELQAEFARQTWIKELKRRLREEGQPPLRRQPVLKRRSR